MPKCSLAILSISRKIIKQTFPAESFTIICRQTMEVTHWIVFEVLLSLRVTWRRFGCLVSARKCIYSTSIENPTIQIVFWM
jgi:hypothetical protein